MTWEKLGLILTETDVLEAGHGGASAKGFTQGPKALVLPESTRVYFSTREEDINGKFISVIRFADFTPDFSELRFVSRDSSLSQSGYGTFDEHGVFPMHVIRGIDGDLIGYTGGWSRRVSVSIDMSIGRAISKNGSFFQRAFEGPVVTSSPEEPFLVGDPFVMQKNGHWDMFYIFGTKWTHGQDGVAERTYKIGHRQSGDGINWISPHPGREVVPSIHPHEAQAMPSVVLTETRALMFFCYRDTFGFRSESSKAYRLAVAESSDLINWTRLDVDFESIRDYWCSEMMCYPDVHVRGNYLYLLFNGDSFGKAGIGAARIRLTDTQAFDTQLAPMHQPEK